MDKSNDKCQKETCQNYPASFNMLANKVFSKKYSETNDALFHRDCDCRDLPGYNNYSTRECRKQGQATQPKTKAVYRPLIDMTPADPNIMMTDMSQSQN